MALQLFKIADATVATPQTIISFSSIPQGYTDLKLVFSGRDTATGSVQYGFSLVFNNDLTGARYSGRYLLGSGSAASSARVSRNGDGPWDRRTCIVCAASIILAARSFVAGAVTCGVV